MAYIYTCPNCGKECSVDDSAIGQTLVCPRCSQEFFATPPTTQGTALFGDSNQIVLPEKIPFFKQGKRKVLEERLNQLIEDGELSDADKQVLTKTALALGLSRDDFRKLTEERFFAAFAPIKQRIQQAFVVTDRDLAEIELLKKKYGVSTLTITGNFDLFRTIYLIEEKNTLPTPIQSDLMLDPNEHAYYEINSAWAQVRKHRDGYSGASVSVPTGIKGVRLRFGHYTPHSHEEITPLSSGTLLVTSRRLLFRGDSRNTTVEHKKIIDSEIFLDCLRVDKSTGKADYFTMNPAEARYVTALIGAFKARG